MWWTTDERPETVYTGEEATAMDTWLIQERGFTLEQLMGEAGACLAEVALELAREMALDRVVLLVGPGNNGGDAVVAGRLLGRTLEQETWRPLAAGAEGGPMPPPVLDARTLLVDGLFGVGLARPVGGAARTAVEHVNTSPAHVLAVDIPSGLSATSGEVVGCSPEDPEGGVAVVASHTLTFVGPKAGFFTGAGPRCVGRWRAAPIGFPTEEADVWVREHRGQGAGA
jgi:NAD(P)H-hydrate repair Nnr-like enzyme with NAD(P)H-hydrate epimerase domain